MWVGLPTALTVLGNRVAPVLLDAFLARTNVQGQQAPDKDPPGERANTWEPVYGSDVQAHGSFDDRSTSRSPQLWLTTHRGTASAAALLAAASGVTAWLRR